MAAQCFVDGIVSDPQSADLDAILGWGFAPYTGGPFSMIDSIGPARFVARAEELAAKYGERFAPPALLKEKAEKGEIFY